MGSVHGEFFFVAREDPRPPQTGKRGKERASDHGQKGAVVVLFEKVLSPVWGPPHKAFKRGLPKILKASPAGSQRGPGRRRVRFLPVFNKYYI